MLQISSTRPHTYIVNELNEIVKAYDATKLLGKQSALASLVHLDGSSYRQPGARMLVDDDGNLTGAISGGCLEGDALRKALLAMSQHLSKLVTYDTNDEDDMSIGIQLGCAGVIQVLFEPLNPANPNNPVELIRKAVSSRQKAVLVTLFFPHKKNEVHPGACFLLESNGNTTGSIPFSWLEASLLADVQRSMLMGKSAFIEYKNNNDSITAFIEFLNPVVSLVVVGAGNDAIPMVNIADTLGWDVRVVDGRNTHAKPDRFASACQVLVSKPEAVLDQINIDDRTAFVMMTHNYNYDIAMLKALLHKDLTYIGMLGPKKKLDRMLLELREDGMLIDDQMLEKVYGPTGLEIGAETPEEIALSIIAEIQSVIQQKSGSNLKLRADMIHSRTNHLVETKNI
jgi:xanthine/CO dehydrogenase XdhC/CoxF family maturation factor